MAEFVTLKVTHVRSRANVVIKPYKALYDRATAPNDTRDRRAARASIMLYQAMPAIKKKHRDLALDYLAWDDCTVVLHNEKPDDAAFVAKPRSAHPRATTPVTTTPQYGPEGNPDCNCDSSLGECSGAHAYYPHEELKHEFEPI